MLTLTRFAPSLIAASLGGFVALPAAADDRLAATAAASPCGPARLTGLQQRVLAHADRGVPEFVRFIHRTRMIYQLDVHEVARSLDGWRATANCARADATETHDAARG